MATCGGRLAILVWASSWLRSGAQPQAGASAPVSPRLRQNPNLPGGLIGFPEGEGDEKETPAASPGSRQQRREAAGSKLTTPLHAHFFLPCITIR